MFKLITILVAVICLRQIESACNTCNKHGVACIDNRKFRICIDGKMDETTTLECKEDEICTDLSLVCVAVNSTTAKPGCTSMCGVCETGKTFACTGVRSYGLCRDGSLSNITGSCPSPKVCDTTGPAVCIQPCDVTKLICDKDLNPTPTTALPTSPSPLPSSPSSPSSSSSSSSSTSTTHAPTPPMTPAPTPAPTPSLTPNPTPSPTPSPTKTAEAVCNEKKIPGRFPLSEKADECSELYVFCRQQGSDIIAIPSKCPTGRSFNKATQSCEISPAGCPAQIRN